MTTIFLIENIRAVEIAACHLSHISAAMFHDGKIFMWGHCRGHSIYSPSPTPYTHLDEVFACYSTPAVTWRTLQFRVRQDTPLAETLRLAFNDQVKAGSLKISLELCVMLVSNIFFFFLIVQNTGDICFKVDGNFIWVHKAILKIRCQYYRSMFQQPWAEADQEQVLCSFLSHSFTNLILSINIRVVEVEQFSYPVYYCFLRYLYTDEVDLPVDEALG